MDDIFSYISGRDDEHVNVVAIPGYVGPPGETREIDGAGTKISQH